MEKNGIVFGAKGGEYPAPFVPFCKTQFCNAIDYEMIGLSS